MARNRQHGALTRRGGAVDWLHPLPHSTHFEYTRGYTHTQSEAVCRGGGGHKERDRLGGQEQCPPIGHLVASRCGSLDASARYPPLGVTAAIEKYRRRSLSAGRRCCVRMLRTSCSSPPPGARSCIHLADILSSRGWSWAPTPRWWCIWRAGSLT